MGASPTLSPAGPYSEPPFTEAQLSRVEARLGVKLPASYLALMRPQNGGSPSRAHFSQPTGSLVIVGGFFGIGDKLCGGLEWALGSMCEPEELSELSAYGPCIADTVSGHEALILDYRACGPEGEPSVLHIDEADDLAETTIAEDFESFVCALRPQGDFL